MKDQYGAYRPEWTEEGLPEGTIIARSIRSRWSYGPPLPERQWDALTMQGQAAQLRAMSHGHPDMRGDVRFKLREFVHAKPITFYAFT